MQVGDAVQRPDAQIREVELAGDLDGTDGSGILAGRLSVGVGLNARPLSSAPRDGVGDSGWKTRDQFRIRDRAQGVVDGREGDA